MIRGYVRRPRAAIRRPLATLAVVLLAGLAYWWNSGRSGPDASSAGEVPVLGQGPLYPVTRVIDGDTIEVRVDGKLEKVRLIGVNTPETRDPRKGVEPFGREASAFTKQGLGGRRVRLEFDVERRDRYGRLLAYVYRDDGPMWNAVLVRDGYAQVMTVPPNVRYQDVFLRLEREAREARRGLWGP